MKVHCTLNNVTGQLDDINSYNYDLTCALSIRIVILQLLFGLASNSVEILEPILTELHRVGFES